MEFNPAGGYFAFMSTNSHPHAQALASILSQVQDLIDMSTYETQTDVAATLAHWTSSIVAGEIRDATLSVFATSDPHTGDVVDRIVAPTHLRLVVTLADGSNLEEQTTLQPSKYPYLVSLRP